MGIPRLPSQTPSAPLRTRARSDTRHTLMYALYFAPWTAVHRGDYVGANALADELIALGEQKGAAFWKAGGIAIRGCLLTLTESQKPQFKPLTLE